MNIDQQSLPSLAAMLGELQRIDEELYGKTKDPKRFPGVIREELEELFCAKDRINEIEEFGDVLFCLASYSRVKNIDFSEALLVSVVKMRERLKLKNRATSSAAPNLNIGIGPM